MREIHLEPWESITETVKAWLPLLEARAYPNLSGEPEVGKFYRLYPEGALSGNNSPYHGSVRVGEEKENLIVYFNGGGVSWNEYTAAHPNGLFTQALKDRYYFNECEWVGDGVIDNGLASTREDNPFAKWSVIDFPYTTGDFHCGNGDFPYTALDGSRRILPHHGYRNVMAVLRMAKPYVGTPKRLLIAGSSAGGWGVSLMAEDVINFFEGCRDITCLVDSSYGLNPEWHEIAEKVWQSPAHIVERLTTDNIMFDSYKALYRTFGGRVRCLFDCSIRDEALVMVQNEFDGLGSVPSREGGEKLEKRLHILHEDMQKEMPGSACCFFNLPGSPASQEMGLTMHTILENPAFFDHKIEGKSVCDWLFDAMNGEVYDLGMNLFS